MASHKTRKDGDSEPGNEPPGAGKSNLYSMSLYYPKNTIYFYGFPAGENSNFFNQVPPWKEELVAARPLTCAGPDLKVVAFPSSVDPEIWEIMTKHLGVNLVKKDAVVSLPSEITPEFEEHDRNILMRAALLKLTKDHSFVMAQPYLNDGLNPRYLIPSDLAIAFNDKICRSRYIPEKYLPESYQLFSNGKEFSECKKKPPLPCVVKVSSSSAGDGVRICMTRDEVEQAKKDFSHLQVKILVEKFIESVYNLGIQFGIPHDKKGKIEIIGNNEQFIDAQGGYLGGVINPFKKIPIIKKVYHVLRHEILPHVRKLGWFGVGGLDVLVDKHERLHFIDPNFRMTAATSYLFFSKNNQIKRPMMSFMGKFRGTREDFINKIKPLAKEGGKNQILKVVSMTKRTSSYGINAGIFFDDIKELQANALKLKELGMDGNSINRIITSKYTHSESAL